MSKKLVVIDDGDRVADQIEKIDEELTEFADSLEYYLDPRDGEYLVVWNDNAQLEALDLLTVTLTLIDMLDIPQDVWGKHFNKMLGYQTDPSRMYKIKKVMELREVEE